MSSPAPTASPAPSTAPAAAPPASPADPSLIPSAVLPDGSDYDPDIVGGDPLADLAPDAPAAETPAAETPPVDPAAIPDTQTFTLGDETVTLADLKEAYGHVQTSVKALRKAQRIEAGNKALAEGFKTKPKETLLDVFSAITGSREQGYATLAELATDILEDVVRTADEPAEKREANKWKAEAAAARAEVERIRLEAEQAKEAEETAKATAAWHQDITGALESGGLPKSDDLVEEVADVLVRAIEAGFRPNLQKAVAYVKSKRTARAAAPIDPNIDISLLPPEVLARIRAADLATVKGRQTGSVPAAPASSDPNIIRLPSRARTS